jgi:hypothetical protein
VKTEDTFRIWDLGLRIWKDMEHDAEGTELICYLFLLRAPCQLSWCLVYYLGQQRLQGAPLAAGLAFTVEFSHPHQ